MYGDLVGLAWLGLAALGAGACGADRDGDVREPSAGSSVCAEDNGGLVLPPGFCATVFAGELGRARHLAVTPTGDVFVAIDRRSATDAGRVIALRDADGNGVAEVREDIADVGGNGIAWQAGRLFVAASDRIVRFDLPDGALVPERSAVAVAGLPVGGDHHRKTVVAAGDALYVSRGSPSNACQVENREVHSPGIDPCPELAERAGVWRYPASELDQPAGAGVRVATGVRNANALALAPDGTLWAAINGRDQLADNWPETFTLEQEYNLPGEEIVALRDGDDRGWPYCYYDPQRDGMMLAPEYGGDGTIPGRCTAIPSPATSLPAHWAPLGAVFYGGRQFPERYRGGMFVANHGSASHPDDWPVIPGYNVVFVPFANGVPGKWEEFATGFAGGGDRALPDEADHRPVGVAVMPDGALLISDDWGGQIWKVMYRPEAQ
jgi:glucose/arabinose dehydrogenase